MARSRRRRDEPAQEVLSPPAEEKAEVVARCTINSLNISDPPGFGASCYGTSGGGSGFGGGTSKFVGAAAGGVMRS